jgi:arginine decarboxylase
MIQRTNLLLHSRVLLIDDKLAAPHSAGGRAVAELAREFRERAVDVIEATTIEDGEAVVISDASISCVFLDWTIGRNDDAEHEAAEELLRILRKRRTDVPVFLMADKAANHTPGVEVMGLANEFVWMLEDTAPFIAGRALAAMKRYLDGLLPPFMKSLLAYTATREHSWAAPGHQGGVAFTKTPEGRVFFDYFGENLFRTDTGIERTPMGSLLDHEGAIGEAEKYAARVFGSHRSYSVLNGTSGSNRSIISAVVNDNDFALCDRNCHKSIEQGLVLSGGIPVFLRPTRNRYGIIGPIPPAEFSPESIAEKVAAHPMHEQVGGDRPVYAVVTNCTYDGMCYHAAQVEELLGRSVDTVHFDEAWYGYARFNPMYCERFAMRGDPSQHPADGPTVFATHSTHKLLAALSQSSYIHIRNGRRPIVHSRFNEAYMAQASTSPLYAIIASNEIGAAMMDRGHGLALTSEAIGEAVDWQCGSGGGRGGLFKLFLSHFKGTDGSGGRLYRDDLAVHFYQHHRPETYNQCAVGHYHTGTCCDCGCGHRRLGEIQPHDLHGCMERERERHLRRHSGRAQCHALVVYRCGDSLRRRGRGGESEKERTHCHDRGGARGGGHVCAFLHGDHGCPSE